MNILFITSDQQRADCYGFEGRKVKTPHLDVLARDGTRFSACITPNLVCQPTRASILTGLLPGTHGVSDNGIDLPDATGEAGYAGGFTKAGYSTGYHRQGAFQDRQHLQADRHAASAARARSRRTGSGPYMGFQHVELMVEGHNTKPPLEPPFAPALRALVLRRRPRRGEEPAADVEARARRPTRRRPITRACRSPGTTRPGSATAPSSSCAPTRTGRSAPGPRFPTRTIRSTAPSRGAACTIPTRSTCPSIARWISSAGRGGTRKASTARRRWTIPSCAISAKKHSRTPVQIRPPAARPDRQLLRHDLADRPQCRPHPGGARHLWPGRQHAGRLLDRPWRLAGRSRPDPQGADGL